MTTGVQWIDAADCFGLYRRMQITAIILAAGKGTRMKSALPKPLHAVGGRPMLAWSIDAAKAAGAQKIVTVLGPDSDAIQSWLDGAPFAIQHNQLGTGDAVAAARDTLGRNTGTDTTTGSGAATGSGTALVMFADNPLVSAATLQDMAARIEAGAAITVGAFEALDPAGYGRVVRANDGTVSRIVEHRDATPDELTISLCNGGIMAVRLPLLFDLLDRVTNDNAKGEFYLTDIIGLAAGDGHRIDCAVVDLDEFIGVDSRHGQARAEAALQQRLRNAALDSGVTMQAPETVFLAADAVIERDVIIEPNVVIGSGCHIGEGSIIRAFSHLEGARLGACCIVGPYARLRPGTDAGNGVKIGNFVEIKNTRLDAGAKANHLTYLGDATIGSAANIGAGTITCNYDGFGKYRTLIGEGAFIGSNSALVAPVSIGARAIIGAGSTITSDVAEDSIAFTRTSLTEKEQAAAAFREKRITAKAAKTNAAKKE